MFFDYGYGEQKGNPKPFRLASVGTGIRMSFYNQVMLRLEWGFPLKLLGMDPLTEGTAKCPGRFHFSLNIEDKIPSEIERIVGEMRQERKEREAWALIDAELNRPGSVPGRKLREYIESADELDKKGRLKEARQKYALALNMGKLLYSQAQKYIEGCPAHEEELMKKNDEALALFRDGKYAEAKKTWQEVEKEAEPRPLDLEF
jgi:tetratricopeptide (TPR) repeat protein